MIRYMCEIVHGQIISRLKSSLLAVPQLKNKEVLEGQCRKVICVIILEIPAYGGRKGTGSDQTPRVLRGV